MNQLDVAEIRQVVEHLRSGDMKRVWLGEAMLMRLARFSDVICCCPDWPREPSRHCHAHPMFPNWCKGMTRTELADEVLEAFTIPPPKDFDFWDQD